MLRKMEDDLNIKPNGRLHQLFDKMEDDLILRKMEDHLSFLLGNGGLANPSFS